MPSFMSTIIQAQVMAMAGKSAQEIADELDLHMVAAVRIVQECKDHKAQMDGWRLRYGANGDKAGG